MSVLASHAGHVVAGHAWHCTAGVTMRRAHAFDDEFDLHLPGFGKIEGSGHAVALLERLFAPAENDGITARAGVDRLARLDLQTALQRPHFRDTLLLARLMQFELFGDRARAADQAVNRSAVIGAGGKAPA